MLDSEGDSRKREPLEKRFKRYCDYFDVSKEQLFTTYTLLEKELKYSIESHPSRGEDFRLKRHSSLKCLDSHVKDLPKKVQEGVYYSIAIEGTELEVGEVKVDEGGGWRVKSFRKNLREQLLSESLPKGLLDPHATATLLLDVITLFVKRCMNEHWLGSNPEGCRYAVGVSWAFPLLSTNLHQSRLIEWSKEFETGCLTNDGVINTDLKELLHAAFDRHDVPMHVHCVVNDTVSTFLASYYKHSDTKAPCYGSLVVGTGFNGSLFLHSSEQFGYMGHLLNLELGNFNKALPWNIVDVEIDFCSTHRGQNRLEKMISSLYLPELCRRASVKIFQFEAPELMWVHDSLTWEDCSGIFDDLPCDLKATREIVGKRWNWYPKTDVLRMIHTLVTRVFDRSAALVAVAVATLAKMSGALELSLRGVSMAMSGKVFTDHVNYQERVRAHLNSLLGDSLGEKITFLMADDASLVGSALLAGVALETGDDEV